SDAGIQVDGHAPRMSLVPALLAKIGIQRFVFPGLLGKIVCVLGIFLEFLQTRRFYGVTRIHGEVTLGNGNVPVFFGQLQSSAAGVLFGNGTNTVCVVAGACANTPGLLASIAKIESYCMVGVAGLRPRRHFYLASRNGDLNHVLRVRLVVPVYMAIGV